jgi:hypothetical protein
VEKNPFTIKDSLRKIKKKKKRSQPKKKNVKIDFEINEPKRPKKFDFLNKSLPLSQDLKKKSKPRKPPKLDFGSFLPKNDTNFQCEKVNNMIHGLNMSKLPETFIDFNCLNSSLNMPAFEDFSTKKNTTRENSLNFSFNPKLNSNLNTNYTLSNIGEEEEFKRSQNTIDCSKTSLFEAKIMSTNALEKVAESRLPEDEDSKPETPSLFSPSGTLSINFSVLN